MKRLVLSVFFFLVCFASYADGYWFEVVGSHRVHGVVVVRLCYGGINDSGRYYKKNEELAKLNGFMVWVIDPQGQQFKIPITAEADCWKGSFTTTQEGTYQIIGLDSTLPVVERKEEKNKNVRPIQYLRSLYIAGSSHTTDTSFFAPGKLLDMKLSYDGNAIRVQVFNNQVPIPKGAQLRIFVPGSPDQFLFTDEQGICTFSPTVKGLYIIRADVYDVIPGKYHGIAFQSTRHRFDYSLLVE